MKLSLRRALLLLSVMVPCVVVWAGCGSKVIAPGSGGLGGSPTTNLNGATSSSGTFVCNGGPDCPGGMPSPGSPCATPGECCEYTFCDHMGGSNSEYATCNDAGTWQWQ
jgi:hypothetical protein